MDWCRQRTGHIAVAQVGQDISDEQKENMLRRGRELLSYQREMASSILIGMVGINQRMTSSL